MTHDVKLRRFKPARGHAAWSGRIEYPRLERDGRRSVQFVLGATNNGANSLITASIGDVVGSLLRFVVPILLAIPLHWHSHTALECVYTATITGEAHLPTNNVHRIVGLNQQPPRLVNARLPDVFSHGDAFFAPESLAKRFVGHVYDLGHLSSGVDVSNVLADVGGDSVNAVGPGPFGHDHSSGFL